MSLTYFIVIVGILIAKSLGFARDIFFADAFGTTAQSDIYFQIFGVVNLVFTCIGIAMSTLVIKNLNKEENLDFECKRRYVSRFITRASLWLLLATAVMYACAGGIRLLLLPDIAEDMIPLAMKLIYTMLPSMFFVVIAYIISGVLQNSRVFFIPSIVSLPYNVLIISTLIAGDVSIVTVGIVTTIGWLLHIVIQLPSFYKKGYRLYTAAGRRDGVISGHKGAASLEMAGLFISNMMFQLCFIIDKTSVSGDEGMIATINYASNLFVTISSVFVVAMSNVIFPAISKNYEEGEISYVRRLIQYIITFMFVIFVPYLLVVVLFGNQIISLVYERGSFTAESTAATSSAFIIYSFGILGYVAQELFNKVMYLASRYRFTVIWTVSVVAVKMICDYFLVDIWGAGGAALTTTLLLTAYAVSIAVSIKSVIGKYFDRALIMNILRVMTAGAAAFAVYLLFKLILPSLVTGRLTFILPVLACGIVYIAVLYISGLLKSLVTDVKNVRVRDTDKPDGSVTG